MPALEAGWIDRDLAAELPGFELIWTRVDARAGRTPRPLRKRMRELANRITGAHVVQLRQDEVPWAYRVLWRRLGLDPDSERTPVERLMVERLRSGGLRSHAAGRLAAGPGHGFGDGRMRHVAGLAALEGVEIGPPLRPDAVGRHQILLVEPLDVVGIGAELRGLGELLQEVVHFLVGSSMGGVGGAAGKAVNYSRRYCRTAPRYTPECSICPVRGIR